jgi:predicted SAM-dependent methyltransferase
MDLIEFNNKIYPKFQSLGNAAQFAIPYAKYFCKGVGVDVGCMKKEWAYPGSIPVDISFNDGYHALNLPQKNLDYIFSSHCLEHLNNWVEVLNYWYDCLKTDGILFLYLPDYKQEYWRPWNNTKHKNIIKPRFLKDWMKEKKFFKVFTGKTDLNCSFMVVGQK